MAMVFIRFSRNVEEFTWREDTAVRKDSVAAQPRSRLHGVVVPHLEAGHGGRHPDEVPAHEDHPLVPLPVVHNFRHLLDDVVVANHHRTRLGDNPRKWMNNRPRSNGNVSDQDSTFANYTTIT